MLTELNYWFSQNRAQLQIQLEPRSTTGLVRTELNYWFSQNPAQLLVQLEPSSTTGLVRTQLNYWFSQNPAQLLVQLEPSSTTGLFRTKLSHRFSWNRAQINKIGKPQYNMQLKNFSLIHKFFNVVFYTSCINVFTCKTCRTVPPKVNTPFSKAGILMRNRDGKTGLREDTRIITGHSYQFLSIQLGIC